MPSRSSWRGQLLPALLNARGRIVSISSISGRVAWPLIGPYTASKFALEAVTDALRREVGTQGVHVVSVEPGGIATPVWDKSRAEAERIVAAMPADARRRYDGLIDGMLRHSARLARVLPDRPFDALIARMLSSGHRSRRRAGVPAGTPQR